MTIAIYLVLTGVITIVPWVMSLRWRRERPDPEEVERQSAAPESIPHAVHTGHPVG